MFAYVVNTACNFSQDGSVLTFHKCYSKSIIVRRMWNKKIKRNTHTQRSCVFLELLINAEDTSSLCVQTVSSAAGSVSSSRGRSPDTDSQHWTSAEGKLHFLPLPHAPTHHPLYPFFVLPLQLTSSLSIRQPLSFYLPQITLTLHYLCLFFRSTCLWHWPHYSIAV